MQVYIVTGGCVKKAEKRVEKENKECNGLHAHIEVYDIEK